MKGLRAQRCPKHVAEARYFLSLSSLNIESEMVSVLGTEASVMMFLLVSFTETGWSNLASIKHLLC